MGIETGRWDAVSEPPVDVLAQEAGAVSQAEEVRLADEEVVSP